jgi:hypothetical protein
MNRNDGFENLKGVDREHSAAKFSVSHTLPAISSNPMLLREEGLSPSDLRNCAENLEVTYLTRLFAEFEAVLRDFHSSSVRPGRIRRTMMETIIDRIAAPQYMPNDILRAAHEVRTYRNDIIHDRLRTPRLSFHECKSRLGRYLRHLPVRW